MQRRQLVSLGAVIALMVVLGLTSGLELRQVQGVTSRVGTKRVPAVQLLANVDADIRAYREVQLEHVLAKNSEAQNPLEARMHASRAAVESELVRYAGFAARGEERQLLTSLREAWSRYVWQANDFLIPSRNQDVETARGYLNGVAHASFVAISANLSALRAANDRAVIRDVTNSRSTTSFGLVLNLALLGIAALVAIGSQVAIFVQNLRTERFRSLVQRSSDLTLVCDPAGHIGYASSAAADMLGETQHTLLGREVVDLIDEQHRPAVAQLFTDDRADVETRADHATEAAPSVECQIAHADGSIRWVELTGTDLTRDPAVKGVVLRLRDITVRRHLEIELRHAQKLESVGQLAAGIAHEINTPLQFIGDNVRFLTDAFADIATLMPGAHVDDAGRTDGSAGHPSVTKDLDLAFLIEEIPQALAETLEGTQRVQTIVRAMKAFGHPGGEHKAPADINEAVANTVVVAGSEIKHVADVELLLAEDLPPTWCMLGDINQVLLILIVNAAQAIGEAHAGTSDRGLITIRSSSDGEFLTIDVQDTGIGIAPEITDRVFDQFFTTKPVGQGTGQGLSLAHTLIYDRHGGTITFATVAGAGTTFTVRIPHRTTNATSEPKA
ncbi:MAG TPA: ATP-binding protein [Kineosporiaceae bacterium]|nr:ATP-binding protein [Kineosporiaceae bacterium]